MNPDASRLQARIRGTVQGVSFRYYTRRMARSLLLTGWARNLPDGSVDVVAEGARPQLESLLGFLRTGPPSARVDDVSFTWQAATGEFDTFEIR